MSVNPWIRLYREALHDPKLVTLPDRQYRAWVNCLLIADDTGLLPSRRDIAVHMRASVVDVDQLLCDLVEAGLLDADSMSGPTTTYRLHGWSKRQYVSDNSSHRVRKHREKKAKQECNGDETLQKRSCNVIEPDTDTESEKKNTSPAATHEVKVGFKFDLNGSGSRDVSSRLKSIAEGFGLNVHKLVEMSTASNVDTPNAYFRGLVIAELQRELPRAPKALLGTALTKDGDAARKTVYQMLMGATNA